MFYAFRLYFAVLLFWSACPGGMRIAFCPWVPAAEVSIKPVEVVPFAVPAKDGEERERYGFLDKEGRVVLAPRYELPLWRIFGKSNHIAISDGERFGLVDRTGRVTLNPSLEFIVPDPYFGDGDLLPATRNGRYGYVTPDGHWMIEPRYQRAEPFPPGRPALVGLGPKSWYIDRTGNPMIGGGMSLYDHAEPFHLGEIVQVRLDGKCGFVDLHGELVVPIVYDETEAAFSGPWASVRKDGKSGYVTVRGEVAVPLVYDEVEDSPFTHAAVAAVRKGDAWHLIRPDGQEVSDVAYEEVDVFAANTTLHKVKRNGKWGFIDTDGIEVIPPQFAAVGPFSTSLAAASLDGENFGFIDEQGDWVIKPEFDAAGMFTPSGLVSVRREGRFGVIDATGAVVVEFVYEQMTTRMDKPYFLVRRNGRSGKLDADGTMYDELAILENGLTLRVLDGRGEYVGPDGNIVFSFETTQTGRVYRNRDGEVVAGW